MKWMQYLNTIQLSNKEHIYQHIPTMLYCCVRYMSLPRDQKYACLRAWFDKKTLHNSDLTLILLPIALTNLHSRAHQNNWTMLIIIIFRIKGKDKSIGDDLKTSQNTTALVYIIRCRYMLYYRTCAVWSLFLQSSYELFVFFCLLIGSSYSLWVVEI